MKSLLKVFNRVLVIEFYRINIGFFFVAIGFFFGFLSGREHKALAEAFISSPFLLLIPFTIWIIYTLKILGFNSLSLDQKENSFLFASASLSKSTLLSCLITVAFNQLCPIIAYGCFLILVAFKANQFISIVQIIGFLLFLIATITWKLRASLYYPNQGKTISLFKRKLDNWLTKPLIWFYPEWILRKQPLLIIGTKLFASLLIIGVSRLYLFDDYDARLMGMVVTLAFSANMAIIYHYHRFENYHFDILRCLPFSSGQRIIQFLLVIALLSLPEWGMLFSYFPAILSFIDLITLYLFGLSIYLLGYTFLFIKDMNLDQFINKVFVAAFTLIILILFKVPVLLIIILHFFVAVIVYRKNFYQFEFKEETGSEK